MNYGEKLIRLKESTGEKHWSKYGNLIGVSGDWLAEQSKKDAVQTIIDISRLIKVVEYHGVTLDYLLRDDEAESGVVVSDELADNDIAKMINDIIKQLDGSEVKFNGYLMDDSCKEITRDALDILKGLIKNSL